MKFQSKIHYQHLYFTAIVMMAIALPLSKFLMSLSQILLLITWIAEGNIKNKLLVFFRDKTALCIFGIYALHLLGLTYTIDFDYGLEDIRKKLPLMILPLVFSTIKPLTQSRLKQVLLIFLIAVCTSSWVSFIIMQGYTGIELIDVRQAFVFISHIRFSLMACLAVFIAVYLYQNANQLIYKICLILSIAWLLFFLLKTELLTGAVVLTITTFFVIIRNAILTPNIKIRIALSVFLAVLIIGILSYLFFEVKIFNEKNQVIKIKDLKQTLSGEKYIHIDKPETENGNYIWHNIANQELKKQWEKRSSIKIDSLDLKGNKIYLTVLRYLTSRALRKDSLGVNSLSDQEIALIERGIPNADYNQDARIRYRIKSVIWEIYQYQNNRDINGHSVSMRFEFFKAACGIIKDNFWFGVGTGDVKSAYQNQYAEMNSALQQKWRLRAHNQFLAVAVSMGFLGLLLFVYFLFFPFFNHSRWKDFLFFSFFIISFLSFWNEDTLETQPGVTFFSFFLCLLVFLNPLKNQIDEDKK